MVLARKKRQFSDEDKLEVARGSARVAGKPYTFWGSVHSHSMRLHLDEIEKYLG